MVSSLIRVGGSATQLLQSVEAPMRSSNMSAALALILVTTVVPAASQETANLSAGTLIRVTSSEFLGGGPEVGTVIAMGGDTLRYFARDAQHEVVIPLHAVTQLEVRAGADGSSKSGAMKGAAWGAVGGAVVGLAIGIMKPAVDCLLCSEEEARSKQRKAEPVQPMAVGALLGAVAGLMIGTIRRGDQWKRVALQSHVPLGISVRPSGGRGVAVALSATF
jgi:hypothetical protein